MDGVIADFVKRYKELYRMEPKEAEKSKKFNSFFDEFIATNQFATLDLMPDAMDAITYLRKLNVPTQILSSTANEKRYDDISKQKMIWLQTHGITFTPNFVPGKKYKYKYAAPDKIIIDDTESVIEDWRKAGGIGILHKDWPTTLAILRLYV
jgi:predicted pyridoxine 5'-phosphate oxidase superfamily flavin-nucleotide-binding protein